MRSLLLLALFSTMMAVSYAHADHVYDWTQHEGSHDLYTSLKDETDLIFILYWFKNVDGNDEVTQQNQGLKDQIQKEVLANHQDIVFTEIDLTQPEALDNYNTLFGDIMQIDAAELDDGPVVAVVNNGEGAWIHGKGTIKEVSESVDIFIHEAQDRKQGGTGYVYGSDKARKDGSVRVGSSNRSY